MKVSDLIGNELDYWVAKAGKQKRVEYAALDGVPGVMTDTELWYSPSTDWSQGGPIIDRERISITDMSDGISTPEWIAVKNGPVHMKSINNYHLGATPLIAAMRCYVASRFGDTVDDSQAD